MTRSPSRFIWSTPPPGIKIEPRAVKVRLIDKDDKVLDEKSATDDELRDGPCISSAHVGEGGPGGLRVEVVYDVPKDRGSAETDPAPARPCSMQQQIGLTRSSWSTAPSACCMSRAIRAGNSATSKTCSSARRASAATLLLSADRAFAQEGSAPIQRFPADVKELSPYDVIIIGDVPSTPTSPHSSSRSSASRCRCEEPG